ncbi:hypothetical protein QAD02_010603 [Eretmocerus hayati]|uniref:Uncharacterized protein n=1 Tax=Eretmocerus hayati TaxID=131215 RepID=A0ACC2NX68_9HYME|nr:hypothetical protein QAD02_010603 [Eretmocerus hayati]
MMILIEAQNQPVLPAETLYQAISLFAVALYGVRVGSAEELSQLLPEDIRMEVCLPTVSPPTNSKASSMKLETATEKTLDQQSSQEPLEDVDEKAMDYEEEDIPIGRIELFICQ